MLRVEVDTSTFPLVVQRIRFGHTDEDMTKALARYLPLFARRQRYAVAVLHEPGAKPGDANMRKLIGAFQTQHIESIKQSNVCVAVVLPSIAHRAAMTGVNWLFPPVTPQRACGSIIEAVDYCVDALSAEGISLSLPIRKLQAELKSGMGYSDAARP
jgi:hypothetical protein